MTNWPEQIKNHLNRSTQVFDEHLTRMSKLEIIVAINNDEFISMMAFQIQLLSNLLLEVERNNPTDKDHVLTIFQNILDQHVNNPRFSFCYLAAKSVLTLINEQAEINVSNAPVSITPLKATSRGF